MKIIQLQYKMPRFSTAINISNFNGFSSSSSFLNFKINPPPTHRAQSQVSTFKNEIKASFKLLSDFSPFEMLGGTGGRKLEMARGQEEEGEEQSHKEQELQEDQEEEDEEET